MARLLLTAFMVLVSAKHSWAAPFDIIVPTDMTINTFWAPGFLGGLTGVIISKDEPLAFESAREGAFKVVSDNPDVELTTRPTYLPNARGLMAHEALISEADFDTFGPLLNPDEGVVDDIESGILMFSIFSLPDFYVGDARLWSRWYLNEDAPDRVFFAMDIHFVWVRTPVGTPDVTVNGIQRISSVQVPEPASLTLCVVAGVATLGRLRRTRKQVRRRLGTGIQQV